MPTSRGRGSLFALLDDGRLLRFTERPLPVVRAIIIGPLYTANPYRACHSPSSPRSRRQRLEVFTRKHLYHAALDFAASQVYTNL